MPQPVAVAVRQATQDDCEVLADAHRLGHLAVADARGGMLDTLLRGRPEPIEATFAADLGDPDRSVMVATADDCVAGYLVSVVEDLRSGEVMLRIIDLWVHPNARGIGLGSALMQNALTLANKRGCTGIDARALPGDRATKNFFESFGLVARTIEVHRKL